MKSKGNMRSPFHTKNAERGLDGKRGRPRGNEESGGSRHATLKTKTIGKEGGREKEGGSEGGREGGGGREG